MPGSTLRVAFLIGRTDGVTTGVISEVCRLHGVEIAAVLVDSGVARPRDRWRNLRRNIRREGISYIFHRAAYALREKLEVRACQVIPRREVDDLLNRAFPDRSLPQLAQKYGFPVFEVELNGQEAIARLRSVEADLGIVLGTRILKRPLFSVPRLGCINLHKGRVPDYRGTPPGFWELYDGLDSAGVTVHFVDDGLDSGPVVAVSEIPIHPKETPESLRSKLDREGCRVLAAAVQEIQQGTAVLRPQPATTLKPRTKPTRAQRIELAQRLPHWRITADGHQAVKLAVWLAIFWSGLYSLVRWARSRRSLGAILLYHRVNDFSQDVLTASTRRFAEHLVTLRHYYRVLPTAEMVERLATGKRLEPTSVAIHFDDCYLDVRTCAAPLLAAAGMPAVAFVSSGFVGTSRVFLHDQNKYPQRFENLGEDDLRELVSLGVSIGAHTVNHVDLGSVSLSEAKTEVLESGRQLERMIGQPVLLFSFPFGRLQNISEQVREMVIHSGYQALFSAHGGFVDQDTPVFDIPRLGVSSDYSPLALMMELEGISLDHLSRTGKRFRRSAAGTMSKKAALDRS